MSKITGYTPTYVPGQTSYENPLHKVAGGDTSGVRAAKTLSDVSAAKGPAANPPAQNTGFAASVAKSAATADAAALGDRYAEAGPGFDKPSKSSDFFASVSSFFKGLGSSIRSAFVSLGESIGSLFEKPAAAAPATPQPTAATGSPAAPQTKAAAGPTPAKPQSSAVPLTPAEIVSLFKTEMPGELSHPDNFFRANTAAPKAFTELVARDSPEAARAVSDGIKNATSQMVKSEEFAALKKTLNPAWGSASRVASEIMADPKFQALVFKGVKDTLEGAFGSPEDGFKAYVGKLGVETRTVLADLDKEVNSISSLSSQEKTDLIERFNSNNLLLRGAGMAFGEANRDVNDAVRKADGDIARAIEGGMDASKDRDVRAENLLSGAILLTMQKIVISAATGATSSKDTQALRDLPAYTKLTTDIPAMLGTIMKQIKAEV